MNAKPIPQATTAPKLVVRRGSIADALREVIRTNMNLRAADIVKITAEKNPGLGIKPLHRSYVYILRSQMRRKSAQAKRDDMYTVDQIVRIATQTKMEGGPVRFRNMLARVKALVEDVGSFERIDKIVEVLGRK